MDVDKQKNEIADIIKRVPTESARARLCDELRILISRWKSPNATDDEKKEVESRLAQLRRDAEIAAQVSLWSSFSMVLVGVILFCFFGGIVLYLRGMWPEPYWTIEATRPIIVFTLIVAMLGFGGLLIVRALFSNDSDAQMQTRFRLAREVFLVFASVFSTVIGFYFGAGTGNATTEPPSLTAPVAGRDGTIVATIVKGRAPFSGRIRLLSGDDFALAPSAIANQLTVTLIPSRDCPAGATVTVTDGDSRQAEHVVEQTAAALVTQGWIGCAGQARGEGNSSAGNVASATQNAH